MPHICRIRAFGACMIGGFPHRYEDSFFHLALERLKAETTHEVASSLFTLGGFPITRVPKHLAARCLAAQPHIVVLQFGASDLIVPIRQARGATARRTPVPRQVRPQPPQWQHRLKWRLRALLGDALQLPPVTPPDVYLATLTQLARSLVAHRVTPVVLTPFVFGGRRSDRFARSCAGRLPALLAAVPGALCVDAYSALNRAPRNEMLLADGTHLSLAGHRVLGETLWPHLLRLVTAQSPEIPSPSNLTPPLIA